MTAIRFLLKVQQLLPTAAWQDTILAWRQEPVVWQAVETRSSEEDPLENLGLWPGNWTPAALGLASLEAMSSYPALIDEKFSPADNSLKHLIVRGKQLWQSKETLVTPEIKTATQIALYLRELRLQQGDWQEILIKLPEHLEGLKPVAACLYALSPDAAQLIATLINPDNHTAAIELGVHALLSNPMPVGDSLRQLNLLIPQLTKDQAQQVFRLLNQMHPRLSTILHQGLGLQAKDAQPVEAHTDFQDLLALLDRTQQSAELAVYSHPTEIVIGHFTEALNISKQIQANLYARIAQQAASTASAVNSSRVGQYPGIALEAWKRAQQLAKEAPDYCAAYALALLAAGKTADANTFFETQLAVNSFATHPGVLLGKSKLASSSGHLADAARFARASFDQHMAGEQVGVLKADFLTDLAHQLLLLGNAEYAFRAATEALGNQPYQPGKLLLAAEAALAAGQNSNAFNWAYLAWSVQPDDPETTQRLIDTLEANHAWDDACSFYQELLQEQYPAEQGLLYRFIECAVSAGKLELAEAACQTALTEDPGDGTANGWLGVVAVQKSNELEAEIYLQKSTQLAPHGARFWLALSELYNSRGETARAVETLQRAAGFIPDRPEICIAIGQYYLTTNQLADALVNFQAAALVLATSREFSFDTIREHRQLSWQAGLNLGATLYRLGRFREARQVFEQTGETYYGKPAADLISAVPLSVEPEFARLYGQCLLELGAILLARPLLEYAHQTWPADSQIALDFARALLLEPQESQGVKLAAQLLEGILEPDSNRAAPDAIRNEALALYAEALAILGEVQAASQAYQKALDTPLADQPVWRGRLAYGMGKAALALNQPETAAAALKDAGEYDPHNPGIFRKLSEAYLALNLVDEAYQSAENALMLDIDSLDNLLWFSDQALKIEEQPDAIHITARPKVIESLKQAHQIAPNRADILLRLGEMQLLNGERSAAVATFASIQSTNSANNAELMAAAEYLLHLSEYQLALPVLDRVVQTKTFQESGQETVDPISLSLAFVRLAEALTQTGNSELGIKTIQQAIALNPNDSSIYLVQSILMEQSGDLTEAIQALKTGLALDSNDFSLHAKAARLYIQLGDQSAALTHADQSVRLLNATSGAMDQLEIRTLAARLAYGTLFSDLARAYLKPFSPASAPSQDSQDVNLVIPAVFFQVFKAELALDKGELNIANEHIKAALPLVPEYAYRDIVELRLAVHQQGLESIRGSMPADCLRSLEQQVWTMEDPDARKLAFYSLAQVAMELGDWQLAGDVIQGLATRSPDEVFTQMLAAQHLIRRAEVQRLSAAVEVRHHLPGDDGLSGEANLAAQAALQQSRLRLDRYEHESVNTDEFQNSLSAAKETITRWDRRRQAVFSPEQAESANEIDTSLSVEEAYAQVIAHYSSWDDSQVLILLKRYPRAPQVLIPAALALAQKNPPLALKVARSAERAVRTTAVLYWPAKAYAEYLLAKLSHQAGSRGDDYLDAVRAIEQALIHLPQEARWHALAAEIALDPHNLSDRNIPAAIGHLKTAVQLEPGFINHHMRLGSAFLACADYQQASQAFSAACQLNPEDPHAWLALAYAQYAANRLDDAIFSADRAIEWDGTTPDAQIMRARLALAAGDPTTSFRCAQTILVSAPESPEAWQLLAHTFLQLDKTEDALLALDKAIEFNPKPLAMKMERIHLIEQIQGKEVAVQAWRELSTSNPGNATVLSGLAAAEQNINNHLASAQAAIHAQQANLGELPASDLLQLNFLIGQQLRLAGQTREAIDHLSENLGVAPEHLDSYLELGRAYLDLRQPAKALEVYKQAIAIAPKDPRPYYQAGIALKESKDYQESESLLRRAAQLAPKDVSIHRQLGAVVALNLIHNRSTQTLPE